MAEDYIAERNRLMAKGMSMFEAAIVADFLVAIKTPSMAATMGYMIRNAIDCLRKSDIDCMLMWNEMTPQLKQSVARDVHNHLKGDATFFSNSVGLEMYREACAMIGVHTAV